MVLVDVGVLVALVLAALLGARLGLLRTLAALAGAAGGGLAGGLLAVVVVAIPPATHATTRTVAIAAAVGVGAAVGAVLAVRGVAPTDRPPHPPRPRSLRWVNAAGGAMVTATGAALACWLLVGVLLVPAVPATAPSVGASRFIASAEGVIPQQVRSAVHDWGEQVTESLPHVGPTDLAADPVPVGAPAESGVAVSQRARRSVVQITGIAEECAVTVSGSGIPYAPERVLTAAHVVAGVVEPTVEQGNRSWQGRVVHFDAARDVAVVAVPGMDVPLLSLGAELNPRDRGAIAGYPGGGDFSIVPTTVIRSLALVGEGWDGTPEVTRDVYHLQAPIVSGYSGGPLLDNAGEVAGMVFASSRRQNGTGYAHTAPALAADAARGGAATEPVEDLGTCQVAASP